MAGPGYRPEIDGLRAVSVLGVLFYHVGLGFPGGFVGVDVFFVISGYLITGLLWKDLQQGTCCMTEFWIRRIRRIFPALFATVVATFSVGYFLLLPHDFKDLGRSIVAQTLLVANLHFIRGGGYFDAATELKPLLHTWSLAVEEQFYLLFPWLLIALARQRRAVLWGVLGTIAGLSLIGSVWGVTSAPRHTFFLLPSRAWELLVGACLALAGDRLRPPRVLAPILAALGLGGILVPMGLYDRATPFPGCAALPPVFGAALVICATLGTNHLVRRWLASPPLVWMGLISYSLYLWHWPLLAYVRYLEIPLTWQTQWGVILGSLGLAWGSWKWIETPFRLQGGRWSRTTLFSAATASQALVCAAGVLAITISGWTGRFSPTAQGWVEDATPEGAQYSASIDAIETGQVPKLGHPEMPASFVLMGDSHALALRDLFDRCATDLEMSGYLIAEGGTLPIPGLAATSLPPASSAFARGHATEQFLKQHRIGHVILAARWSAYIEGLSPYDLQTAPSRPSNSFFLIDHDSQVRTPDESYRVLSTHLQRFVHAMTEAGTTVWVVEQLPESQGGVAEIGAKRLLAGLPYSPPVTHHTQHVARQARARRLLQALEHEGARLLSPADHLFDASGTLRVQHAGRFVYRDDDHITNYGARALLTPLFKPMLSHIAATELALRPPHTVVRPVTHETRRKEQSRN